MDKKAKITTGTNDRPRNETIAQTGPGLPDDSGSSPEASERQAEPVKEQMTGNSRSGDRQQQAGANPDRVPEGTPGAGENICRRCGGSGKLDGGVCPDCGGTGVVVTPVGGGG